MKLKKRTTKTSNGKKRKSKRKMYFGKEAHEAIVSYQNSKCLKEKQDIYHDKIKRSFEKLVENLIFIHGFSNDHEEFKILKTDCVTFLFETLEKFDHSKGSKAFSYFNVCAKNFLIIKNKKKTKNIKRSISIDDFKNLSVNEKSAIENFKIIPSQEDILINEEDKTILKEILQKIKIKITNSNEKLCIDSIIKVFDNIDQLDFLNKRAVFVYLRNISGLNPKQLSVSISNIRKIYKEIVGKDDFYMLFKNQH
jgi:hypothetical protein